MTENLHEHAFRDLNFGSFCGYTILVVSQQFDALLIS